MVRSLFATVLVMCATNVVIQAQKRPSLTADAKIIGCIKNGDVVCLSDFFRNGGNVKAVDKDGLPLLTIAAETKNAPLVRLLINAGADANDGGPDDETPLCHAARFGRKEIAQTLLDSGAKADVICNSDHGDSVLMIAISGSIFSEPPFVTFLTSEDLPDRGTPEDYLEIARLLLTRSVDVNVQAKCDVGETALMFAAMAANVDMVKTLLSHGADATQEPFILDFLRETESEFGRAKWMPVPAVSREQSAMLEWMEKTRSRREEITRLLKAAGAKESERDEESVESKIDAEDYARETFNDAIERNDIKDFERLVTAYKNHPLGASVLPNALRCAVIDSRVEMVKVLLKHGVDPNIPSTAVNYTPLMQAASSGDLEVVKLLLDAGAELNLQDDSGRTALDAAEAYASSSEGHQTVAAFLLERGARRGKDKE